MEQKNLNMTGFASQDKPWLKYYTDEQISEIAPEEDPNIHRVIPITDEDIEMLNKKLAEDLAKQQEQEEREKNNI